MQRNIVNPWSWQDAYGFVQANAVVAARRTLYTAGVVSVDPNGQLLYPDDMARQIGQIMDNLETLFNAADFCLSDVVRLTYYTTDVKAFAEAGPVLMGRLKASGCQPATTLLGVAALFHPACVVEISATAVA